MIAIYDGLPPSFRSFLDNLTKDLISLANGSIEVKNCLDHGHTRLQAKIAFLTSDQEAKLHTTNLSGYNSRFGCFYCNIPGRTCTVNKHVYFPFDQSPATLRSSIRDDIENNLLGDKVILYGK